MDYSLHLRELTIMEIAIRILFSLAISSVIGLERELKNRAAGLRTYALVCMGACVVMMTNQYIYQFFNTGDPVRMGAQVISGIGFLGAGTIIVTKQSQIKGLTTAAGLWAAACLGLSIGIGFYEVAVVGGVCVLVVLTLFQSWEECVRRNAKSATVYVEIKTGFKVKNFLDEAREKGLAVSIFQMDVSDENIVTLVASVKRSKKKGKETIMQEVDGLSAVAYLEEV